MPSYELPRSGVRRPRLEHLTGHVQRHPLRMLAALFTLLAGAALVLRAALSHAPTRTIPLVGRPYATDRAGDPPPADVLFNFVPGPAPSREHDLLSWGHLGDDGNVYPPLYVPALNLAPRVRGGIMILADLPLPPTVQLSLDALTAHVVKTLRSVEGRFNRWWAYPIIIVHHIDLDDGFRRAIRGTTRSEIRFVRIPESDWQPPSGVSQADVQQAYDKLAVRTSSHRLLVPALPADPDSRAFPLARRHPSVPSAGTWRMACTNTRCCGTWTTSGASPRGSSFTATLTTTRWP